MVKYRQVRLTTTTKSYETALLPFSPNLYLVIDSAWHLLISSFRKYEPLVGYLLGAICSGSVNKYEIHTLETVCKIYVVFIFLGEKESINLIRLSNLPFSC